VIVATQVAPSTTYRGVKLGVWFWLICQFFVLSESFSQTVSLGGLSSQESQSIESACFSAKQSGPAAYNRCLVRELEKWHQAPKRPSLSGLSSQESQSIESACFSAKQSGPAAYNRCLVRELGTWERSHAAPTLRAQTIEPSLPKSPAISPAPVLQTETSEHTVFRDKNAHPTQRRDPALDDVRKVQRLLAALGFSPGAIDGIYGPKTKHAIEVFQERSNLPITGTNSVKKPRQSAF
jgi:hypothetical protein